MSGRSSRCEQSLLCAHGPPYPFESCKTYTAAAPSFSPEVTPTQVSVTYY